MHGSFSSRISDSSINQSRELDQSEDHGWDSEFHSGVSSLDVYPLEFVE